MNSQNPSNQKSENEVDELDEDDFELDAADTDIFDLPLEEPKTETLTVDDLHEMIHSGGIDLNPPYQRDVVWPETKQVALIDSIFRNFFIPPVIFAVQKDDEGVDVRICVDGKQRLTSIQKFIDGQIPHKDSRTKKNYWFANSDKMKGTRTEVPEHLKKMFKEKRITVVQYCDIPPGTERDIFQRVQMGMPLTAAEKLQAISSPWGQWITHLESKHVSHEDGLANKLAWDTKRGRDFQNVAHMVYCCDGLQDEVLPTAQKIEKWMNREDEPPKQFKDEIDNVLRSLWVIASGDQYNMGFTKVPQRIAPVEFIFIGVLLYVLRKEDYNVRGKAIYALRSAIRRDYKDIRNNSDVGKAMWRQINLLSANPKALVSSSQGSFSKSKRKRTIDQDEDDEEFRPQPVKGIGRPVKTRSKI